MQGSARMYREYLTGFFGCGCRLSGGPCLREFSSQFSSSREGELESAEYNVRCSFFVDTEMLHPFDNTVGC